MPWSKTFGSIDESGKFIAAIVEGYMLFEPGGMASCSFVEGVLEADGVVGFDSFLEEGDCGVAVGVKFLFVKGGEVPVLYFFIESGFNYLFYTA